MKKILFSLIGILLILSAGMAQGDHPRHEMIEERVEAQRVAFITQRLRLTTEESQAFWPVFNEFEDKMKTLKAQLPPRPEIMKMSDSEAEAYLDKALRIEQEELDLKRSYVKKFKEVLPVQKVAMLGHVERAFNRELLKRIQEGRRN